MTITRRALVSLVFVAPLAAAPATRYSVLVFGGSGRLGAEIVRSLLAAGHEVSVFLRPSSDRARIAGLPVVLIEGNALIDADVGKALQSRHFDVIVNALGRSEQDASFYGVTGKLIAKWAKSTAVGQVILHSSVGVGDSRSAYRGPPMPFMVALVREKEVAENALLASGVAYTIIRNDTLRDLPAAAPDRARLYADHQKLGTVSRRGLARLTAECIAKDRCLNKIFHAVDDSMTR